MSKTLINLRTSGNSLLPAFWLRYMVPKNKMHQMNKETSHKLKSAPDINVEIDMDKYIPIDKHTEKAK